jgi:fucose permease
MPGRIGGGQDMQQAIAAHLGLVIAGCVSFIVMGAAQAIYGPAIPAFARDFGIATGSAGLLISAHWVGSAFGVALMFLRDRWGTPRMARAGMTAGAAIIAAGAGFAATLVGAVVLGFGIGISTVVYNRRFLARFGARGPSMVALLNAIFAAGAIGAPLAYVAAGSDPQLAYAAVAVLAALTLVVARDAPPATAAQAGGTFAPRLPILVFGAIAIGIEASLIGLGPVALIALGQTEAGAARALSAFFTAFLLARLALVGVAALVPPFPMYLGAVAATALGAALLAATGWTWVFVAMGASASLFFPAFYVSAVRLMGDHPRVTPTVIAAGLAGGISAPVALGGVMASAGNAALFPVVAGVAGLTALAALAAARGMGGAMSRA